MLLLPLGMVIVFLSGMLLDCSCTFRMLGAGSSCARLSALAEPRFGPLRAAGVSFNILLLFFLSVLFVALLVLLCQDSFFIGFSHLLLHIVGDSQLTGKVFEADWAAHDLSFVAGQTTEHRVLVEEGSRPCDVPTRSATATRVVPILIVAEIMLDPLCFTHQEFEASEVGDVEAVVSRAILQYPADEPMELD